jgi:hypothetical protein
MIRSRYQEISSAQIPMTTREWYGRVYTASTGRESSANLHPDIKDILVLGYTGSRCFDKTSLSILDV